MKSTLSDIQLINLPKIEDPRGNLSIIEEEKNIPFKIERTYCITICQADRCMAHKRLKKYRNSLLHCL